MKTETQSSPERTFIHDFGRGIRCKLTIAGKPAPGLPHVKNVEWTRQITQKLIPEYKQWIHSINERLATEWDMRIMYVLPGKKCPEMWFYCPNTKPQLLKS